MADSSVPNFWNQAWTQVERVEDIVSDRIADANTTSDYLRTSAMQTIAALGSVSFDFNPGPIPAPPAIDSSIEYSLELPPILPTSFGEITSNLPDRPALENGPDVPDLTIPDFVSSISSLSIPTAPAWNAPGAAPSRPAPWPVSMSVPR